MITPKSAITPPAFVQDFCPEPFRLAPLSGGLSNLNYQLTFTQTGQRCVYFVRQFGSVYSQFDNNPRHEVAAQNQAALMGLAPHIVYNCEQGIISEWVEGEHWDNAAQGDPANIAKLAKLVADLHQLPVPKHQLDMASRLQHYYGQLQPDYQTTQLSAQLKLTLRLINHGLVETRYGFCHHDMNPLNFLLDQQGKLHLLDWEFAAAGHCDFDIVTLFQTFAWQQSEQAAFLLLYNQYYPGAQVDASQLDKMAVVVEMMTLLWCILMYQQNQAESYHTLWQQSELALAQKIKKLNKESQWDL
ncbi:MAG: thiamine kinase [Moritella sp.]|jgi:thiamine kinase